MTTPIVAPCEGHCRHVLVFVVLHSIRPLYSAGSRRHIQPMHDRDSTSLTFADWIAALDRSEAQIDTGDVVPGETGLAELQASLDRPESKLRDEPASGN
jgi:hypothetical protein